MCSFERMSRLVSASSCLTVGAPAKAVSWRRANAAWAVVAAVVPDARPQGLPARCIGVARRLLGRDACVEQMPKISASARRRWERSAGLRRRPGVDTGLSEGRRRPGEGLGAGGHRAQAKEYRLGLSPVVTRHPLRAGGGVHGEPVPVIVREAVHALQLAPPVLKDQQVELAADVDPHTCRAGALLGSNALSKRAIQASMSLGTTRVLSGPGLMPNPGSFQRSYWKPSLERQT